MPSSAVGATYDEVFCENGFRVCGGLTGGEGGIFCEGKKGSFVLLSLEECDFGVGGNMEEKLKSGSSCIWSNNANSWSDMD